MDIRGLNQLIKALKVAPPTIRIGVLGSSARTSNGSGKNPTNAEVGAVHEFGAPARGIPQRSFLRMPLADNLGKQMEASGLLGKEALAHVVSTGNVMPWIQATALVAEAVVEDAFEQEGPGWAPWAEGYSNEGGSILTDSGQLRRSISTEIKS